MPQLDEKQTVKTLKNKKKQGQKISVVTAYDYPSASVASDAGIDMILVGDSLGMVLQGHKNTLEVTMDEMIYHTRMVSRCESFSMIVSDMPFGSYHIAPEQAVTNAVRLIKEGGAEAVKLEGGRNRFNTIKAIIDAEIPVLGHLGLTPQSIHRFGGFKPQGKLRHKAEEILDDAKELENLGAFAIVLESVPTELAKTVSEALTIPTIGIGAGKYCDGQVLVFHDLVGFTNSYLPKFVRKYADIYTSIRDALEHYKDDVEKGLFPGENESYHMKNANVPEQ
jgi:3-methyl-2-oxobutanoate hydroxymethyltransferase